MKKRTKTVILLCFSIAVVAYFSYGSTKATLQADAETTEIKPVIIYEALPRNTKTIEETTETIEESENMTAEAIEMEIEADEMELLAQVVEAEAGGETFLGKCLVVDVILNRVKSEDFPDTITEVIYQPNQFSCVSDGGLDRAGYRMQEEDYKAVSQELETQIDYEILFFTAEGYSQYCKPCYKVGGHYFGAKKGD